MSSVSTSTMTAVPPQPAVHPLQDSSLATSQPEIASPDNLPEIKPLSPTIKHPSHLQGQGARSSSNTTTSFFGSSFTVTAKSINPPATIRSASGHQPSMLTAPVVPLTSPIGVGVMSNRDPNLDHDDHGDHGDSDGNGDQSNDQESGKRTGDDNDNMDVDLDPSHSPSQLQKPPLPKRRSTDQSFHSARSNHSSQNGDRSPSRLSVDAPSNYGQPAQMERTEQSKPKRPEKIYFYDRNAPYYSFTNFSPDPVRHNKKLYPTSEHLFQAMKFLNHRPGLAEHIRTYSSFPRDAFTEARRFAPEVRPDWHDIKLEVMKEVLELKFECSKRFSRELLETEGIELLEDSPVDAYWGIGADRNGENRLGMALMELRDRKIKESKAGDLISFEG